MTMIVIVLI